MGDPKIRHRRKLDRSVLWKLLASATKRSRGGATQSRHSHPDAGLNANRGVSVGGGQVSAIAKADRLIRLQELNLKSERFRRVSKHNVVPLDGQDSIGRRAFDVI